MLQRTIKAAFGLLTFLLGTQYACAQLDYVVNEPFTATETQTVTRNGKTVTESIMLARASDGSIYRVFSSKAKSDYRASIDDVPNHRIILLDPQKKTYVIQSRPDLEIKTDDDIETRIRTRREAARERASLEPTPNGEEKHSDLGTRVEDGITLYGWGIDYVMPRGPLKGKPQSNLVTHSETWSTDFGVNVSYEYILYDEAKPDLPKSTVREQDLVTDLQRAEPDPSLFRIPEDYTLDDTPPPPVRKDRVRK